ncbi:hypothetical protein ACFWPQ_38830 [Streptomyces sp. NPDC058464]|uniref:hypothetical protein n=1 Tax=Streptomyces sp. NPDC058464 TaxID=3346511 RepID=UPI0036681029
MSAPFRVVFRHQRQRAAGHINCLVQICDMPGQEKTAEQRRREIAEVGGRLLGAHLGQGGAFPSGVDQRVKIGLPVQFLVSRP